MKISNISFLSDSQKSTLIAYAESHPHFYLFTRGQIASKPLRGMLQSVLTNGEAKTGYTNGSGRFSSAVDKTGDLCKLLDILGISYVTGNNAPRGGVNGNFVRLA